MHKGDDGIQGSDRGFLSEDNLLDVPVQEENLWPYQEENLWPHLRSNTVVRALHRLIRRYRPSMIFLSETKMKNHKINCVCVGGWDI